MSGTNTPTVDPADAFEPPMVVLRPGDRVADRYEILRVLGSGGSAIVYAARDTTVGDEVALKVLRPERRSAIHFERSRREAEFARSSASPRLVRTFDLQTDGDVVFLTMELVGGGSLRDVVRGGPLPIEEVIRLAHEILEALIDLHGAGIVHRDIKPGNLLLTRDGHVKLSDFGVARRWSDADARLTVTGLPLGTIDYLSPEQARGLDADPRSDLYSFGVVLYEMLTGRVPFRGESMVAAIVARLDRPPADVRELRPDTPQWLADIVARLLKRDPRDRYRTAEAVLADLRKRRVSRAHRTLLLRLAIAGAVLMIAAAVSWTQTLFSPPRLVADGEWGMRAIDADGDTLWTRADAAPWFAAIVHRRRFAPAEVVTIRGPSSNAIRGSGLGSTLSFLDSRTGRVLRTRRLPSAAHEFGSFADHFGVAQIVATDLDSDGSDEVVVAFAHDYYPCFMVLHDLRRDEARIVFVGSGHHRIVGTADVDGDGVKDLIISGIANRMGWYLAVAAIRVRLDGSDSDDVAYTPDFDQVPRAALLWYGLTPQGAIRRGDVTVDERERVVHMRYRTRAAVDVGFDGFVRGKSSSLAAVERRRTRERAYARLRDAVRLARSDRAADALMQASAAEALAIAAGDATLTEWIRRVKATTMVQAGQFDAAERLFEELAVRPDAAADLAWDAGRAFHLAGELPRAVSWYRGSFGTNPWIGRLKYEVTEGLVLALGEMGRWDDALAEADRFEDAYPAEMSPWYRRYAMWRSGAAVSAPAARDEPIDLYRYWSIEIRLANGADPRGILAELDREERRSSEPRALLLSCRAAALHRAGRDEEALRAARAAFRDLRVLRRTDIHARAHFDLAAERLASLAGRDEAQRVRAEADALRWRALGIRSGHALPRRP